MRRKPSEKTIKMLFAASGNKCAFPGCGSELVNFDAGIVLGEVCHINSASLKGPRYDPSQTESERNEHGNLIILCPNHHRLVDQDVSIFTAEYLRAIKATHAAKNATMLSASGPQIGSVLANNLARQVEDESIDFLIVTASQAELTAILKYFPELKCGPNSFDTKRRYYHGEVRTINGSQYRIVAMVLNSIGNLEAAHATSDAIRDWNPRFVVVTGVVGGLMPGEQSLGDIVVSESITYYEFGTVGSSGTAYRRRQFFSDPALVAGMRNLPTYEWHALLSDGSSTHKTHLQVHVGSIASGEKVVADVQEASRMHRLHERVIAVEMESAGAASAAYSSIRKIGSLTIRSICDFADGSKNDACRRFAAQSAAACTRAFLVSEPVPLSQGVWPKMGMESSYDKLALRRRLFKTLRTALDMEEFMTFCFLIGVEIEELGGGRKTTLIRELVLIFEQRQELDVLEHAVRDFLT